MKKKTTFGLLGVLAGAGAVGGLTALGNYYYDSVMIPRKHDPASDTDPEDPLFLGRRWLKESPVRRDIFTASVDGLRLHAHVLGPASPEGHHWAVCIHGYADAADSMGLYARHYYEQGYGVLLPDLRGHGESEGSYVGLGWDDRLDIVAWISRIIHRDPKAQIVLHGVSMGAATALMTAGGPLPDNVRAAVSDCAFSNAEDLLAALFLLRLPPGPRRARAGRAALRHSPPGQVRPARRGPHQGGAPVQHAHSLHPRRGGRAHSLLHDGRPLRGRRLSGEGAAVGHRRGSRPVRYPGPRALLVHGGPVPQKTYQLKSGAGKHRLPAPSVGQKAGCTRTPRPA